MRIEIDKKGSRDYFDELLYVSFKKNELKNKPDSKVEAFTTYFKKYAYGALFGIVLMLVFYLIFANVVFIFLLGMFVLLGVYIVSSLLNGKKVIEAQVNAPLLKKSLELNEEGVDFADEHQSAHLNWDEIAAVVLAKHSICFLPKDNSRLIIAVLKEYGDSIVKALHDYQKENLLLDKSGSYK